MSNERKRNNSNEESNKKRNGSSASNSRSTRKLEGPLDWDARDLKIDGRLPRSSNTIKGEFTHRFWEEEEE